MNVIILKTVIRVKYNIQMSAQEPGRPLHKIAIPLYRKTAMLKPATQECAS
jgi:hypothetical protein